MSLPGKLCVGILEEDNPLRSYFRFKPLLIDQDGRYVPYEANEEYPKEGCIRIVPDKNESYHFKTRMRQIGLFCVIDLRQHPGESDKIRPNKNFRPDGEETNANIIYSDVVRAPAADMIFGILPAEAAEKPLSRPGTDATLLREEAGIGPLRYGWEPIPDADGAGRLVATEAVCPLEAMQVFDLPGFRGETVSFAIRPAGGLDRVSDLPEPHAPAQPEPTPAKAEPAAPAPARPEPRAAAEPVEKPNPAPERPVKPEKPWLHGEEAAPQPQVNPHMSRTEQLLAAQVGLNPRRGRSLQELIDEKWQRSRLNQLGQPVQPIATGAPVTSPLDAAVSAVREAWQQPQLRGPLMTALGELDALDDTLEAHREARRQAAVTQELDALEAQKLQLLAELEHLKAGADDVREKLRQEIYRSEARALEATLKKTEAARAEQARFEQLAADARAAAQDARALVDRLTGEELEQKIRDVALTQRVLERLEQLKAEGPAADIPAPAQAVSLEACVDRVRRRFATEGWELSPMEAANLCVCLAVSPALLITGAPGSGKTTAARLLAEALGLADRAPALAPGCRPEARDDCLAALRRHGDAPALVLLDDANLAPGPDPLQGLCVALSPEWRVIATLQDSHSGHPVCAAAWDAGFAVRLTPPAELPWRPAPRADAAAEAPVSIAGLLEALPCAALPEAMEKRMEALRRDLAAAGATLSRRALNDAWRYASAMLAALGESADPDALLDLAVAQRLLPGLLASAPIGALTRLRPLLKGLPACTALLDQPLPVAL